MKIDKQPCFEVKTPRKTTKRATKRGVAMNFDELEELHSILTTTIKRLGDGVKRMDDIELGHCVAMFKDAESIVVTAYREEKNARKFARTHVKA